MRNSEPIFSQDDGHSSPRACGPLPKSDSVQSLVSLMHCPALPSATTAFEDLTVRGVDGDGQTVSVKVTSDIDVMSLSGKGLRTITLSAFASLVAASSLREISLAANTLELVDLSPLASCPSLTVLCLNSNKISSLDLRPLASCVKLERLWVHDNRLESIDLSPLKTCKALRSLYLEDNSLHETSLDLSSLSFTQNLRSLRLGGNRLAGKLDITALLQCPALSVFNIDSSVKLISDGESSQARVSPALRRIVLDVNFSGRPVEETQKPVRRKPSPPLSPNNGVAPHRLRRKVTPPGPLGKPTSPTGDSNKKNTPCPIVRVLLVGFRRLARYAAEDALSKCGKVMIRAGDQNVASRDPGLLLDSHVVILYAPNEKTLRHVTVVVGRTPTVVIGTERYRSNVDTKTLELLGRFNFYTDPLDPKDTRTVYNMGRDYANGRDAKSQSKGRTAGDKFDSSSRLDSSPVSEDEDDERSSESRASMRKCYSEPSIPDAFSAMNIELEDIEDEDVTSARDVRPGEDAGQLGVLPRSHSADVIRPIPRADMKKRQMASWSDVSKRLQERKGRRSRRGLGSFGREMSMHGKNKLRAERASVEVAFHDLGGYATVDSCAGIARSCGLPKCAGPVLFGAAYGSSFEIESTTPEAGVPNPPMERKNSRISLEAFLAYWDSRLKTFDGEERLCNILEDSYAARTSSHGRHAGHSRYGAPIPRKAQSTGSLPVIDCNDLTNGLMSRRSLPARGCTLVRTNSSHAFPSDICCPCDAGIEELITAFMEGRSSRFGSFALVKMSEAIAIGSALVMYGLRGASKNRVGGRARPVCPKEVRDGKLNAALIAAEVGIFEGVASGLSMDQIRSVKGSFATEASSASVSRSGGIALNYTLRLEDVQRFCTSRRTLLPGAVEMTMAAHCRNTKEMTLAEFSVFLSVLNNISSNGAVDYFFTVVDTDQDEMWTLPDLRHFHMEKEKMWLNDGMAVSDLVDIWVNLIDMIRPSKPTKGISRRELSRLGAKERKMVLHSLLFVDDDHSLLNIRRTMEMNQNATSPLVM